MAYSEEQIKDTFDKIVNEIEEGRPLRRILSDDKMPSSQTFYKWLDSDEGKSKLYMRACEVRAESMFEDMIEIADGKDVKLVVNDDGVQEIDNSDVNRNKLQVETRKWALAKMNPKKYGDQSKLTLEGGDKPITIDFTD